MAEKGAHLTGTTLGAPTIFEIVAQESLATTLEPAFKKVFNFLATCNAERYEWVVRWSDEAYLVFHALLQNFYLRKYGASFAESFYGLRRVSLLKSATDGSLSGRQERLSVILLILHPYLKSKADKYKLDEIDGRDPETLWKRTLRSYFVKFVTFYHYIRESSALLYYVMYISGRNRYPTPIHQLLTTTLTYSRPEDVASIHELLTRLREGSFHTGDLAQLLQRTLTRSLELGAFFLQFVQWWNRENYTTNLLSLPVPPAPVVPSSAKQYKGLCPVCRKTRRIHTVLSVSGYVFCYQCVLPLVRKYGVCPVTKVPAKEDDLIRLYLE